MPSGGFHSCGLGEIRVAELEGTDGKEQAQEGPGQGEPFGLLRAEAGRVPHLVLVGGRPRAHA